MIGGSPATRQDLRPEASVLEVLYNEIYGDEKEDTMITVTIIMDQR